MRTIALVAVLLCLLTARGDAQAGQPPSPALSARAIDDPGLAGRIALENRSRSHWRAGAIAGFVIGGGATYFVLRSGESTAPCDRSANQDAIGATECAGLALAGGLIGAGLGALIGSRIRTNR